MRKYIVLPLAFLFLFLFGCPGGGGGDLGPDNLYVYKDVVTVSRDSIPEKCWNKEDCGMFDCLVDMCWCKPTETSDGPTDGVVFSAGKVVTTDEAAKFLVAAYLDENEIVYTESSLRAVELNELFYNVFYEDKDGNEGVLTVGKDGTIMVTVCGV